MRRNDDTKNWLYWIVLGLLTFLICLLAARISAQALNRFSQPDSYLQSFDHSNEGVASP